EVELDVLELFLVRLRGPFRLQLALDPVNGARRDLDPIEERLAREAEVRALVVGRNGALVAPPDAGAAPIGLELCGKLVGTAWRRAAGERKLGPVTRRGREQLRDGTRRP